MLAGNVVPTAPAVREEPARERQPVDLETMNPALRETAAKLRETWKTKFGE
jgi:hypothetical protein